jgi:hypothetical protein
VGGKNSYSGVGKKKKEKREKGKRRKKEGREGEEREEGGELMAIVHSEAIGRAVSELKADTYVLSDLGCRAKTKPNRVKEVICMDITIAHLQPSHLLQSP